LRGGGGGTSGLTRVFVMGVSVDPLAFVSNVVAQRLDNVAARVRELS
jgi:hypothetical protein